jgi:hypothetical protein
MESTNFEGVQAEQAEDENIVEQSGEVEIETEVPVAPEHVEVELTDVPVAPQDVEVKADNVPVAVEDVEVQVASIPIAPEEVEIEVASSPMELEDSLVAPDPPQIEQFEKCEAQSFFYGGPASCALVDEEDNESNEKSMTPSPSHDGQMHQSLPYSVLSEQQAFCKL